jgi:sirohydrochlorin ferrochelatase
VCSPGTGEFDVRSAFGAFVKALRRAAPALEVRDVPIDHLPTDSAASHPRIAVPLSLTNHGHVAQAVAAECERDPDLVPTRALGPDWVVAEVCVRRLVDAGAHQRDTIVMGVAGSDDPAVIADYSRAAQLLSAVWGGPVHLGSVAGSDTSLTDAIDIARAYGRRVVIASYLLTSGPIADAMRSAGADIVTAPILDLVNPDRRLVNLVVERCREAVEAASAEPEQLLAARRGVMEKSRLLL